MKKSAKIAFFLGIFIFILGGIFVARTVAFSMKNASAQTYSVRQEIYEDVIEIAGTVSAAKSQTLKSLNDGTVVGVYKSEGDIVKEGDLIVQLDDSEQLYNLANLDYEISVARQNQTAGKLALMQTQRKSLLQKIRDRKIVATFDGIIASLDVDSGDYLEAKDSIGTLVDTSFLTAEVEIAETDVSKLAVGQKVEFDFPAVEGKSEGYVSSFPAIGEVTSRGATVVKAKVRLDEVPEGVLPNFSFTGQIKIHEGEERLIVERYAIGREAGGAFVDVVSGNDVKRVFVSVEPYSLDYVRILSGLSGGEILKAQSSAEDSGKMRTMKRGDSKKNAKGTQTRGGQNAPPSPF